ncbi:MULTISPECIES: alpha/beta hydrolase [unclassified Streptomyces]|uniref:alpha/beta hydrolase n=1 Tax=unclassified Streptomyces TaxID=2593676 RepID=UPI000823AA98|nr:MULTISPECIES: alpha/beta hydrolase [unclassified Streptomyces]SCK15486.1 Predicted hydrolases or acyltransferases (alpha/beta hydrolase superfamily) [Streptomyces sp. AmelKG-E11A]
MKRFVVITAAAAVLVGAQVVIPEEAPARPRVDTIAWAPCPADDPLMGDYLMGLECGSLKVPLDHSRPEGRKITLELTRAKHTSPAKKYQGAVLLNRGQWPGTIGRDLPTRFADGTTGLPKDVGSTYDWIGFDPRGVGASEPKITCDPDYLYPAKARPDYVPRTAAQEREWLDRARAFADSCSRKYGASLKHLGTKDMAHDMDLIRRALGQERINYLGYSYGTYLGSVYATLYPNRVRRMVLDGVVRPSTVGYQGGLDQNVAFQKRAEIYFDWIARHDSVYHLGATRAEVEANYYKGMDKLRDAPIDGKIGPAEYNDIFIVNGYRTYIWSYHAEVLADWVLRGNPAGLRDNHMPGDYRAQNTYAMYAATQCRDSAWPRDWQRWKTDHARQQGEGFRFMTWHNAWYNAPCAFWPVTALPRQKQNVGASGVNMLLVQAENDAATPVAGAHETHQRFPDSRFVLERGGNFHGTSLTGNANQCMNTYVADYLRNGTRPSSAAGPDAHCEASPPPQPSAPTPLAAAPGLG